MQPSKTMFAVEKLRKTDDSWLLFSQAFSVKKERCTQSVVLLAIVNATLKAVRNMDVKRLAWKDVFVHQGKLNMKVAASLEDYAHALQMVNLCQLEMFSVKIAKLGESNNRLGVYKICDYCFMG